MAPLEESLGLFRLAARSAAKVVCDLRRGERAAEQSAVVVAVARAVAMQRQREARLLLEHRPDVGQRLRVEANRVKIIEPDAAAEAVRWRRAAFLVAAIRSAGGDARVVRRAL